jgi:hypothetical protein
MPRLTDHDYLQNHELLRIQRGSDNTAFVMLSVSEQWDLFQYYLPHKAHKRVVLLTHRREVSELDPSLPQRAGRAFSRWRRILANLPGYREYAADRPRMKKNAKKRVVIFSEVHPELDAARMARIIVEAARERTSTFPTVGVSEPDTALTEPRLDSAGTEAEPLTDASK